MATGTKLSSNVFTTGFPEDTNFFTTNFFGTKLSSSSQNGGFDADKGYVFGGAVNYQWDNGLILELEAAYRRNKIDLKGGGFSNVTKIRTSEVFLTSGFTVTFGPTTGTLTSGSHNTVSGKGHISAVSLMANAWYEFNIGNSEWKPYVGGGVGIAWLDLHAQGNRSINFTDSGTTKFTASSAVSAHGTESGFAWQLGAGIGYEFAPGKQITLDYRYFRGPEVEDVTLVVGGSASEVDIGYDYDAHNIMLGIKLGI